MDIRPEVSLKPRALDAVSNVYRRIRANKWGTIFRNSGIVLFANFVAKILVFLATALIARTLQPDDFGWYALIIAYVGFMAVIPELGMDALLTRDMARDPQAATTLLGSSFTLRMLSIMLSGIVGMIVFYALGYPARLSPIFAIALTYIFSFSLSSFVETYFRAQIAMGVPATIKVCAKAIFFGLVFFGLRDIPPESRLLAAIAATMLPDLLGMLCVALWMWLKVRPTLTFGWSVWRALLHECWPLALANICVIIFGRIDVILLSQIDTSEAVGNYAAAYGIAEIWGGTAVALGISLLPILSQSKGSHGAGAFWQIYQQSFVGMMFILIPLLAFFTIYADQIITLIYGPQYSQAPQALSLVIWGQFFVASTVLYINALTANGRQKLILAITATSALVNVVGNLILIPRLSIVGAAITTTVSYAIGNLVLILMADTRPYTLPMFKASLFPAIAALAAVITVKLLSLDLILGFMVGGIVYLPLAVILPRLAENITTRSQ